MGSSLAASDSFAASSNACSFLKQTRCFIIFWEITKFEHTFCQKKITKSMCTSQGMNLQTFDVPGPTCASGKPVLNGQDTKSGMGHGYTSHLRIYSSKVQTSLHPFTLFPRNPNSSAVEAVNDQAQKFKIVELNSRGTVGDEYIMTPPPPPSSPLPPAASAAESKS